MKLQVDPPDCVKTGRRHNQLTDVFEGVALQLTAPRSLALQSRSVGPPRPSEVVVRLEGCGLCHSSLPVWQGREWFEYPRAAGEPGHEGWGRIAAVGEEVGEYAPGERVTFLAQQAYAEYVTSPAEELVRIPDSLADRPFPGEPLGCAMNIFSRCEIQSGQTVAIIGLGFLGCLLAQLASHAGARVFGIARRSAALEMGRRCGAEETIEMDDHWRVIERVQALTGGRGCERVIEATGSQWPLDLAGELTGERGRLIVAGYHQDGPRQVSMQMWNWKGLDVINAHERDPLMYLRGIREAVAAVEEGRLNPFPLFTHTYPLALAEQAFHNLEHKPDDYFKGLLLI